MGAVQFGVFFFAFMLGETMVNDQAARFFTPQMVNMVYAGGIACTGLGCLSFGLVQKRWNTPVARQAWLAAAGGTAVACGAGVWQPASRQTSSRAKANASVRFMRVSSFFLLSPSQRRS